MKFSHTMMPFGHCTSRILVSSIICVLYFPKIWQPELLKNATPTFMLLHGMYALSSGFK